MRKLLFVLLIPSIALAEPAYVEKCFQKAYNSESVPEVKPRFRLRRAPKECRTFRCVWDKAPKSRKILQVYRSRKLIPQSHWGNLGWAEDNVAVVRSRKQIGTALELARGIEKDSLTTYPENIAGDRDFHDRLTKEMNCLRRNGENVLSFNEITRIPR